MSKLSIWGSRERSRESSTRARGRERMGKPGRGKLFFPPPLALSHVLSCLASFAVNGELASRLMLEVKYEMPAKAWLLEA